MENANDDRYFSAEVHRLSARCLVDRGEIDAARTRLKQALELSRSQEAHFFEVRAAAALACISPQDGREALRRALATLPEPERWPEIEEAHRIAR